MNSTFLNKIFTPEKAIYLLFVTYSVHILRNISLILYFSLFMVSYFFVFLTYADNFMKIKNRMDLLLLLFFLTFSLIPLVSFLNLPLGEFITALSRFIPALLFLITFIVVKPNNYKLFIKIYSFFIFFTFLSALSIILQFMLNFNFDFLAAPGGREGLTRYASFLGSLTTFGTLGPYAIFAIVIFWDKSLSLKKQIYLLFVIIIIIIASILNLQKASIINLIIVFLFYFVFFLKPLKSLVLLSLSFLLIITLIVFYPNSYIVSTFLSLLNYTFFNEYHNFYLDLLNRFSFYISQFLIQNDFHISRLIWGFGFKASSGTLGLPTYVNFHNIYYEMFFSGGFFHLFLYLMLFLRTFFESLNVFYKSRNFKTRVYSKFIFLSIIYFMTNMLIGAGTIYHPIGGSLIIVLIFFSKSNYINLSKNINSFK
jgi:hypothetical protein